MANTILGRGAEAILSRAGKNVVKERIAKGYRHKQLDQRIRKRRTRREAKLLEKARTIIPVPDLLAVSEEKQKLSISFIDGEKVSDCLEKIRDYKRVCKQIGMHVARLHDAGVIHGDLTTSNMILSEKKVYFIDFGLGFHSSKLEDKAVDLHLLRQALESKHSSIHQACFNAVLKGYGISDDYERVLKRFERVERRGRYKKH